MIGKPLTKELHEKPYTFFERALLHFGVSKQVEKTQEECAELIAAFHHYSDGKITLNALRGKIADVIIMVTQMQLCFGLAEVKELIEQKIKRTEEKMTHGKN